MRNIIFVFLDGIGIGKKDTNFNPFFKYGFKTLEHMFGVIPDLENQFISNGDKHIFPTDAVLGVEGLPQSGTGQTSIFCGINAQELIGKHFGPFPFSTLHPIIEKENIFKYLEQHNNKTMFANAFPSIFFDYLKEGKRRLSVTSLSCILSNIPLCGYDELKNGDALSAEIDNHRWVNKLKYNLPIIEPELAAERLLKLGKRYNFVLFEYFYSDHLGHGRLNDDFLTIFKTLDRFLFFLLTNYSDDTTIIICSDHGNLEDMSIKTHTLNPALTIAAGKNSNLAKDSIKGINDFKNYIINELC